MLHRTVPSPNINSQIGMCQCLTWCNNCRWKSLHPSAPKVVEMWRRKPSQVLAIPTGSPHSPMHHAGGDVHLWSARFEPFRTNFHRNICRGLWDLQYEGEHPTSKSNICPSWTDWKICAAHGNISLNQTCCCLQPLVASAKPVLPETVLTLRHQQRRSANQPELLSTSESPHGSCTVWFMSMTSFDGTFPRTIPKGSAVGSIIGPLNLLQQVGHNIHG